MAEMWKMLVLIGSVVASSVAPGPTSAVACDEEPFTEAFEAEIAARWPRNRITAEVLDVATGCRYSYNRDNRQSTASVIKISIMAATLLRAQDEERGLTDWERSQIIPMISQSDNPTASRLWISLGGSSGMQAYLDRFGLEETTSVSPKWGASITSASDQVDLITQLMIGSGPLDAVGQAEARSFMLAVIPEQQWGATAGVPAGWPVPMKNGFYPSAGWDWRINTVGFIDGPARNQWVVAILTDGWSDDDPGIEAAEFVAAAVSYHQIRKSRADHPFIDVPAGAYYEDSAARLFAEGVLSGTSPLFFSPRSPVTRAQLAVMLYRLAGQPPAGQQLTFADVPAGTELSQAASWAVESGAIEPLTDSAFSPWTPLSRGDAAVVLHRYAGSPAAPDSVRPSDVWPDDPASDAIRWLLGSGISNGSSATAFGTGEALQRAHAVVFIDRLSALLAS